MKATIFKVFVLYLHIITERITNVFFLEYSVLCSTNHVMIRINDFYRTSFVYIILTLMNSSSPTFCPNRIHITLRHITHAYCISMV